MRRLRRGPEAAGSVLMLVPAGILVLLVLGAVAVDSAVILLAERELANRTAAASNDIAGAAVDDAALYESATVTLDQGRADTYVALAFAPDRRPAGYRSWSGSAVTSGRAVTVVARAEVDLVFAKAIPGVAHSTHVEARSVATVRGG